MSTKREQYSAGREQATAKAHASTNNEIAALWTQISDSYRFLMEREDRLVVENREREVRYPGL
jgi:hypothetical protein